MHTTNINIHKFKPTKIKTSQDRAQDVISKLVSSLIKQGFSVFCTGNENTITINGVK